MFDRLPRIGLSDVPAYVRDRLPFDARNLSANVEGSAYVVRSYDWYILAVYVGNVWTVNVEPYRMQRVPGGPCVISKTTSRHLSTVRRGLALALPVREVFRGEAETLAARHATVPPVPGYGSAGAVLLQGALQGCRIRGAHTFTEQRADTAPDTETPGVG